jgi:hypothetical protein
VKTSAPEKTPPTKVDMIKPIVIVAIPAPASKLSGETPSVFNTPKPITRTAIAPIENCKSVAAWAPMRVVKNGFARCKNSRIINQKPTIRMIRKVSLEKINRFIGAATNRSKRYTVPKPKTIRKVRAMANFLKELIKSAN